MNPYKFRHFFLNKYVVSHLTNRTYFLSYNYEYKMLWFRNYKVASSTIKGHIKQNSPQKKSIYGSEMAYIPGMFKGFYKFAFVREPLDRFISAYKNRVLEINYFRFNKWEHEKMKKLENFVSWVETMDINHCDPHIRSQNSLIDLNEIDFLGRFENFQEDFEIVCQTVGLPVKDFKAVNKSKIKEVSLDSALEQRIRKLYEMDYRIFYPDGIQHLRREV